MNFAQLNAFGIPSQVVDWIEGDEPGPPGLGEVLVEILACPINPAELLIIEGRYARAWLAWGLGKDAPRVFCPNAELFDEISAACRRDDRVSQAMESEGRRP